MTIEFTQEQAGTLMTLLDVALKNIGLEGQHPKVRELFDVITAAAKPAE